jgi:MFS family permease
MTADALVHPFDSTQDPTPVGAVHPRRLGQRLGVVAAAYAFAVAMLTTTLPTPLYDLYRHRFAFSALMVTVIFATYALGVIASLLLFGRMSDEVGRRSMLLAGLMLSAAGMTAFLLAHDVALLLVGRFLCGLSAGIFTGTATAAIIDLTPADRRDRATLLPTLAQMGGLGLGPLLAGLVANWAGAPLRVPYWVALGLLIPAAFGVWAMPEASHAERHPRLRLQLLRVPEQARVTFRRAAFAASAGFAVLGLFTALSPTIMAEELGLTAPAVVGAVVSGMFIASTAGELCLARVPGGDGLRIGCLMLIAGMGLLALSLVASSLALLVMAAVIAGFGEGLGFRAGLAVLTAATPVQQRGEVTSAFFVIAYGALALPAIGVGVLAQITDLRTAGLLFTALVAVVMTAYLRADGASPSRAAKPNRESDDGSVLSRKRWSPGDESSWT